MYAISFVPEIEGFIHLESSVSVSFLNALLQLHEHIVHASLLYGHLCSYRISHGSCWECDALVTRNQQKTKHNPVFSFLTHNTAAMTDVEARLSMSLDAMAKQQQKAKPKTQKPKPTQKPAKQESVRGRGGRGGGRSAPRDAPRVAGRTGGPMKGSSLRGSSRGAPYQVRSFCLLQILAVLLVLNYGTKHALCFQT
jgi:hypothetical protein